MEEGLGRRMMSGLKKNHGHPQRLRDHIYIE